MFPIHQIVSLLWWAVRLMIEGYLERIHSHSSTLTHRVDLKDDSIGVPCFIIPDWIEMPCYCDHKRCLTGPNITERLPYLFWGRA